jgi:hypothetical protein
VSLLCDVVDVTVSGAGCAIGVVVVVSRCIDKSTLGAASPRPAWDHLLQGHGSGTRCVPPVAVCRRPSTSTRSESEQSSTDAADAPEQTH